VSDPAVPPLGNDAVQVTEARPAAASRRNKGLRILLALLIVIVCLELGLFLLVFPWTDYWTSNYFATFVPKYFWVWESPYFKGAISGLGVVNLFICFSEIFRLRRFSGND
jgi:hypothetical protein